MAPDSQFTIDARTVQAAGEVIRKSFKPIAGKHVEQTMSKAGSAVSREARKAASRHKRTGKMQARIRSYRSGRGLDSVVKVRARGPVAHLIVQGVRPHDEQPRNAEALEITPLGGGVAGFTESVHHPGFGGDPFFARGVDAAMPEIKVFMDLATNQVADDLAKEIWRAAGLRL